MHNESFISFLFSFFFFKSNSVGEEGCNNDTENLGEDEEDGMMEEGRWQRGGENSASDSGSHICVRANSCRS